MSFCADILSICDLGRVFMVQDANGVGFDFCIFLDYDSSNDFTLYEIGRYNCVPCYSYGPVIRTRAIFHFIKSGKGKLVLDDREFEVFANQGFFIPAGVKAYYEADRDDPWSYMWMHLGGPKFLEIYKEAGLSESNPIFKPKGGIDLFSPIFSAIENNSHNEYLCYAKLYELCDYLVNYSTSRTEVETDVQLDYVKKIIKYIRLKYCEQIQVSDIANACGLNRSYLTRLFKEATGSSVQNYLMTYRMKAAIKLMYNPDLSIQYISFAVGYGDVFTFSKAFKKMMGMSPSDYRAQLPSQDSENQTDI